MSRCKNPVPCFSGKIFRENFQGNLGSCHSTVWKLLTVPNVIVTIKLSLHRNSCPFECLEFSTAVLVLPPLHSPGAVRQQTPLNGNLVPFPPQLCNWRLTLSGQNDFFSCLDFSNFSTDKELPCLLLLSDFLLLRFYLPLL